MKLATQGAEHVCELGGCVRANRCKLGICEETLHMNLVSRDIDFISSMLLIKGTHEPSHSPTHISNLCERVTNKPTLNPSIT